MSYTVLLKCHCCGKMNRYDEGDVIRRGCDECCADWFCDPDECPTVAGVEHGREEPGELLAQAWGIAFERHFAHAYRLAEHLTSAEGVPYPGAAAITMACSLACRDTFEEALIFTGSNVEDWLRRARSRQREEERR
jgi:hypothetical protein